MTFLLGDAQLAAMRADVLKMLPGTAIIQAVSNVSDGMGGWSETWAAVTGGTVAARLDPLSARTMDMVAKAEGFKVEYQLTLPYTAPISVGHRISYGGTVYEVRQLANNHSWNVSKRAMLARVE